MTKDQMKLKTIPFNVHIPNLDGDGIAYTVPIDVEAYTDPETGEDVLTPESMEEIEKVQARHMGLMSAEDMLALRERLDLSQQEMSELLQIGAKSYTRWESGRARPSRSLNVILCALRDGQLDVNYLRALRNPEVLNEWHTGRCNYLWDFATPRGHPQPRGILRVLDDQSKAWFVHLSTQTDLAAEATSIILESAFATGKTAWRAAMLGAMDASAHHIQLPPSRSHKTVSSHTALLTRSRPAPEISLDDESITNEAA